MKHSETLLQFARELAGRSRIEATHADEAILALTRALFTNAEVPTAVVARDASLREYRDARAGVAVFQADNRGSKFYRDAAKADAESADKLTPMIGTGLLVLFLKRQIQQQTA